MGVEKGSPIRAKSIETRISSGKYLSISSDLPGCALSKVQFEGGFSRSLISDIEPNIEKGDPFSHPSGSNSGPRVGVQSAL